MIIDSLQFIFGAIFLYFGAELLIQGSKSIAVTFKISPIIIGITIVAVGTSLPELIVSIIANIKNETGIVIGNIMGSNIANIGLVLGLTAIFNQIVFNYNRIRFEIYFLIFVTIIPLFFLQFRDLDYWHGMFFVSLLIIYCIYLFYNTQLVDTDNKKIIIKNNFNLLIKIICGMIGLSLGANLFVNGAQGIALFLGVSSLIVGMSIVALGTSLPELAASITAAKYGETDFIIGNVIGSNIMNIVLVLGVSLLFGKININTSEIFIQGLFLIFMTFLLYFLLKWKGSINKSSGIIFVILYISFLYLNFQTY